MEEIGVEREKVGLTPEEILSKKRDEIVQKALESETLDPIRLALFKLGKYEVEHALYRGEYVTKVKFGVENLKVEEVYFGIGMRMNVWFLCPDGERLGIEVRMPQPFFDEELEMEYNKYYRIWAQRKISRLDSQLTRAKIVIRKVLSELRRKEPELYEELLIERATENASIEQLLEELGVEIEDC